MNNNSIKIVTSLKRKSISILVHHDCSVRVLVPKKISQKKLEEILKAKESWIAKKIEYFKQKPQAEIIQKEYKEGDFFYYLGLKYKLEIIESKKNKAEVLEDKIILYKNPKTETKNALLKWFAIKAEEVFTERLAYNFEIFSQKYKYPPPFLKIRKMKLRWGSMHKNGIMTLNLNLIHTPLECVDYVIMHELCHLKHQNHKKEFYLLQLNFIPHYKELKKTLNSFNAEIKTM